MHEILKVSSNSNDAGIVVVSNEDRESIPMHEGKWNGNPTPGTLVHIGTSPEDNHEVYRLSRKAVESQWVMFVKGDVTAHQGAVIIERKPIESRNHGVLLAIGADALIELRGFERDKRGVYLILDGVMHRCDDTEGVRMVLGLIEPDGEQRPTPPVPPVDASFRQSLVTSGYRDTSYIDV